MASTAGAAERPGRGPRWGRRAAVFGLATALLWVTRVVAPDGPYAGRPRPAACEDKTAEGSPDDARARAFRLPSGRAPALSCADARAIVAQARSQLGYAPDAVDAAALAEATGDWLDPYGLWSVAPDSPVARGFRRQARQLVLDLEGRSRGCDAARALGTAMVAWVDELRATFDRARGEAPTGEDRTSSISGSAFEGATVTRPARALATTLGHRIGTVEREVGPAARSYAEVARARYFPALDGEGWASVIIAAAVRAYVPAIDPHGAWAPMDEESSVYEVDLEARPPTRLWEKAERTAIGIRIDSGAAPPLAEGDVVLSLGGVATAGLSYEQMEQLGLAASEMRPAAQAVVLRGAETKPRTVSLDGTPAETKAAGSGGADDGDDLPVERIEYGDGDAVVVAIHDVRDDLGDELTHALLRERERSGRAIAGIVLDLRGNGGGSTDGAMEALGLFMPGASLFPMKRRDGSMETDRAPEPAGVDRWRGPVATLVDGETASAAEMIAGALSSYRRGPSVGATTFGKGCAQEYLDDDAHAGVLRLTTLLYALPDGSPVQRIGLTPSVRFPFATADGTDREAALPHAPPVWRGPDVRDRAVLAHAEDGTWIVAWPPHGGDVGPCKDADMCRALRLLGGGSSTSTARRPVANKGR